MVFEVTVTLNATSGVKNLRRGEGHINVDIIMRSNQGKQARDCKHLLKIFEFQCISDKGTELHFI
jgi:hypothetical protein